MRRVTKNERNYEANKRKKKGAGEKERSQVIK
jgi:hypothetical protein